MQRIYIHTKNIHLPSGLNAAFGGVLRGCGRQKLGACMNLVGWWGITIPLAVYLGLHEQLGTWGFWAALAAGTSMQVKERSRHNQMLSRRRFVASSMQFELNRLNHVTSGFVK